MDEQQQLEEFNNMGTVNFRLASIEETLKKLEAKLECVQEIAYIKEKMNECIQAINAHDQRIKKCEMAPIENKANKWQQVTDMIFKAVITGIISYVAIKLKGV